MSKPSIAIAPDGSVRAITNVGFNDISRDLKRKTRWAPDRNDIKPGFKSRWGAYESKLFSAPFFSYFPDSMSLTEREILIRKHRLEDLQKRIAMGDYESNDYDLRSPSPEPIYDPVSGVRINTREMREREKMMNEMSRIIEDLAKIDTTFVPPAEFKLQRKSKKLYIPDPEVSSINYIGLVLGPKGQMQKKLESETNCRICVRGRNATKGRIYNKLENDENDALHVLVTADDDETLAKGVEKVQLVLNLGAENQKNALMQYTAMNMVLKNEWCETCGEKGHKAAMCPYRTVIGEKKKKIVYCNYCKEHSHSTFDCPFKRNAKDANDPNLEEEFHRFMDEMHQKKLAIGTDQMPLMIEDEYGNTATSPFDIPKAQVTFKGSIDKIDPSKVRILNPNLELPGEANESNLKNPIMNPIYATIYAPYMKVYNEMTKKDNYVNLTMNAVGGNSSLGGFPRLSMEDYQNQMANNDPQFQNKGYMN